VYKAMHVSIDTILCLYRKDPKKKSTGRKGNTPRGTSPQIIKVIGGIMDMRKNTVTKAITARKADTKVNIRTTNISNKMKSNVIKLFEFPLRPL
jgi:hypothetical protein